jgi:hypothetical protein
MLQAPLLLPLLVLLSLPTKLLQPVRALLRLLLLRSASPAADPSTRRLLAALHAAAAAATAAPAAKSPPAGRGTRPSTHTSTVSTHTHAPARIPMRVRLHTDDVDCTARDW